MVAGENFGGGERLLALLLFNCQLAQPQTTANF